MGLKKKKGHTSSIIINDNEYIYQDKTIQDNENKYKYFVLFYKLSDCGSSPEVIVKCTFLFKLTAG